MKNFSHLKTHHGNDVFKEPEAASISKEARVAGAAVPIQEAFEKKIRAEKG